MTTTYTKEKATEMARRSIEIAMQRVAQPNEIKVIATMLVLGRPVDAAEFPPSQRCFRALEKAGLIEFTAAGWKLSAF